MITYNRYYILFNCLLCIILCSCAQGDPKPIDKKNTNAATNENNTGEAIFDSAGIAALFDRFPQTDSVKKEVYRFYAARNHETAWLTKSGITLAATDFYEQPLKY